VLDTLTSSVINGSGPPVDSHGSGIISTLVPTVVVRVEQAENVPTGLIAPSEMETSGYWAFTASSGNVNKGKSTEAILYVRIIQ